MPVLNWQGRLNTATAVEEVVSVARDFLASFSPYEIAVIPEACKPPGKIYDGEDLTTYAFELVRHDCDKDLPATAELVHKFARFFSGASIRLSEIQAHGGSEDQEDNRQSA